jgi:hypothetical protein
MWTRRRAAANHPVVAPPMTWHKLTWRHRRRWAFSPPSGTAGSTGEGQYIKVSADVAMAMVGNLGYIGGAQVNREDHYSFGNYLAPTASTSKPSQTWCHVVTNFAESRDYENQVFKWGLGELESFTIRASVA